MYGRVLLASTLLVVACDGSAGGGGGERGYAPPAEVKIALAPGEKVVCEVSSSRFGFPVASPPGASIYFWGRHRFECYVEPAPPGQHKPVPKAMKPKT